MGIPRKRWPVLFDQIGACEVVVLESVSYTHLRAHETVLDLVCRLLLEKKHTQVVTDEVNLQLYRTNKDKL